MLQSDGVPGTPQLDYDAWREMLRSMCGRYHADKLFARICGVIKDSFPDPDFGPVEAAAEVGISLRYVQKLFTERGTTCSL